MLCLSKKKSDNQDDCLFLRCAAKARGRIVLPISDELQNNSTIKIMQMFTENTLLMGELGTNEIVQ